jgi:hypothetical protein
LEDLTRPSSDSILFQLDFNSELEVSNLELEVSNLELEDLIRLSSDSSLPIPSNNFASSAFEPEQAGQDILVPHFGQTNDGESDSEASGDVATIAAEVNGDVTAVTAESAIGDMTFLLFTVSR